MKMKKIHLYAVVLGILVLSAAAFFSYRAHLAKSPKPESMAASKEWSVDNNGYLEYHSDRGPVLFNRENYGQDENSTVSRIVFKSKNANIYGLLVLPTSAAELLPGVIFLPGAGVSKEIRLDLAKKIAGLGAAVLVLDQRGVGETDGPVPSLDEDYAAFASGNEPQQHLVVYDALRAYDLMQSAPFTDPDRIIIAGESLGGRIAIIAAAVDPHIKGVLAISTAGFDFKGGPDKSKNEFLQSIDADHYAQLLAPRKLAMMHSANDRIIPLSSAAKTFSKAQEPKQFILINGTNCHGYCDAMDNGLVDALDYLVGIRSKTILTVPERK